MIRWLTRFLDALAAKDAELAAERAARAYLAQRLAELKADHAKDLAELHRRLAIAQANFEWLTVSHNQLSAERSRLMLAKTGIALPSPEVVVTTAADAPPSMRPADERPLRSDRLSNPADMLAQGLSFDDMGDRDARAMNLDDGLVYDNPRLVS